MKQGARLITKLWNASRLIELQIADCRPALSEAEGLQILNEPNLQSEIYDLQWSDRALLSWLQRLIERATASFRAYEYAAALEATERFFWGTFCDNYLEWVKARLYDGSGAERRAAQLTLSHTLLAILKLLAPIMPHITEEIHSHLYRQAHASAREAAHAPMASIHALAWPQPDDALIDAGAERAGEMLLAIAGAARRFKSAHKLGLGAELAAITIAVEDAQLRMALEQSQIDLRSVTRARSLAFIAAPGEGFEEAAPRLWARIE